MFWFPVSWISHALILCNHPPSLYNPIILTILRYILPILIGYGFNHRPKTSILHTLCLLILRKKFIWLQNISKYLRSYYYLPNLLNTLKSSVASETSSKDCILNRIMYPLLFHGLEDLDLLFGPDDVDRWVHAPVLALGDILALVIE